MTDPRLANIRRAAFFLASAGILFLGFDLIQRAIFELSGVLSSDALIFQTVGRGILNGLIPYRDLFETKPPGIFLLSALSLWATGDAMFAKVFQAAVLLGIPVALLCWVWQESREFPRERKWLALLLTLLFGSAIAVYAGDQAGLMTPESYGAFFAIAFLATTMGSHDLLTWKRIAAASLLLLLSLGMKEPFLLSIFAAVLLLVPSVRLLLRRFLLPLAVAFAFGVFLLTLLSYLKAFVTIYLPHMLGFHIVQLDERVWLRGLAVVNVFLNLSTVSPWLAASIVFLWICSLAVLLSSSRTLTERVGAFMRWIAISYLTVLAAGVGGDFYGHHFIFALPAYAAFFVVALRKLAPRSSPFPFLGFSFLLSSLLLLFGITYAKDLDPQYWKEERAQMEAIAAALDRLMDRCGVDRYLQLKDRGGGPYAYTKHSPLGPLFVHYNRFMDGNPVRYATAFNIALTREAKLLFLTDLESTNLTQKGKETVGKFFTEEPWPCAEPFAQPLPYRILFRRIAGATTTADSPE